MKIDVIQDGIWWSWIEHCDKCGNSIRTHFTKSTCEPDMEQADFCVECIRYLLDNKIPYTDAKKQYKKSKKPNRKLDGDRCPRCSKLIYKYVDKACSSCGQRIDWNI